MAKVAAARPASQRTRSRTTGAEPSSARARSNSDGSVSLASHGAGEPHVWHCDIKGCSKFFMREADLRRHQRTSKQHNNKAYYCGCGRSFTRQDATRRHCLSFGHDIPASVLRGIPDDGPPVLHEPEDPPASGIALLVAAAASLSAFSASSEASDAYSSDPEGDADADDDQEELTSSSASSSLLLMRRPHHPPASDNELTPVGKPDSRKRKFALAADPDRDDPLQLDLASSWSSSSMDTFPPMTPSTHVSLSPVETGPYSRQRTPSEPHPLRRSHTLDVQIDIAANVDQLSVADSADRPPLHRTKRSRSLLDSTLDAPAHAHAHAHTHALRVDSRSESAVYDEPLGRYI